MVVGEDDFLDILLFGPHEADIFSTIAGGRIFVDGNIRPQGAVRVELSVCVDCYDGLSIVAPPRLQTD